LAKIRKPANSKQLATFVAKVCDDKIANDILILDLKELESTPTDFFVICSCDSQTQVAAIVDEIIERARLAGVQKPKSEGMEGKEWALLDFFDVVAHVMLNSSREYYRIEKLWADASFHVLTESGRTRKLTQKEILEKVMIGKGE